MSSSEPPPDPSAPKGPDTESESTPSKPPGAHAASRLRRKPSSERRPDTAKYEVAEENAALHKAHGAGEWLVLVAVAIAVSLLIRVFAFQPFYIPSSSMVPTLQRGDKVLVNKLSYRVGDIHRGDVIVFERPPREEETEIKDLIKRVIALPGDTVEGRGGFLYVNGELFDEAYTGPGVITQNVPLQRIPPDRLWVMGDNRRNSSDSRDFGSISESLVVGRAIFTFWPISRLRGL